MWLGGRAAKDGEAMNGVEEHAKAPLKEYAARLALAVRALVVVGFLFLAGYDVEIVLGRGLHHVDFFLHPRTLPPRPCRVRHQEG